MDELLTEKQILVLKYVAMGHNNKEIAEELNNTPGRIQNIRGEILLRTRMKNLYQVLHPATKEGVI